MTKIVKEFIASRSELNKWRQKINQALSVKEEVCVGDLSGVMADFYREKKDVLLNMAKKYPVPFYAFDAQALKESAQKFKQTFNKYLPNCRCYYAVKSNYHPYVLKGVVAEGFNLDVSSARELMLALKTNAAKILFSGPGKTNENLALALRYKNKVTVNLDSFGEMERLGKLTDEKRQEIAAGVRIFTRFHGNWSKFGIALDDLKLFWLEARKYPYLKLSGIQFHISWNKDANTYQQVIKELGGYLKKNFTKLELQQIKYIDFGGGYLPDHITGDYPWGTAQGDLLKKAAEHFGGEPKYKRNYYVSQSASLDDYAKGIALGIKNYLSPLVTCDYFAEPGRIICNNALHLVMKVADIKKNNSIIMNIGVNAAGWEGLRYDYTPLINLSNFSPREISCTVFGNLCMADDVWSYSFYAKKITVGDLAVVPNFGAYTFTLAQNFIHPIPEVYPLK